MFFLVYVSSATQLLSEEKLLEILEASRRNNQKQDITGLLLYKDGNFMQFLEGPKENVCTLVEKIEQDPRHRGVIKLLQQEQPEREFSDWAMGFRRLGSEDLPEVPGYSDFLDLPLTSDQFVQRPSQSLKLLLNFKKIMR